jgi:hypothetical protein
LYETADEDAIMDIRKQGAAKRLILSLAAGAALSGCVYGPPYAAYNAPYGYGYPAYAGPPVSLSFGYSETRYGGGHGWRGNRGWRDRR